MKKWITILAVLAFAVVSHAVTLEVSIPAISVPGATVGTQFDVPISVSIPDGAAGQGLARLYVRVVSTGGVIAPVADNASRVQTTWASAVSTFGAQIPAFLKDLNGDGTLDAGDTGLVDLGNTPNNLIGIGGSVVVLTERWQFVAPPGPGPSYTLAVQFSATPSRHYDGAGNAVAFTSQTVINGSVTGTRTLKVNPSQTIKDLSASYLGFDAEDFNAGADFNWMLTAGRTAWSQMCQASGQRCWRLATMNRYSYRGEYQTRRLLAWSYNDPSRLNQQVTWWFNLADLLSFCRANGIKVIGTIDSGAYYDVPTQTAIGIANQPQYYLAAAQEACSMISFIKSQGYLDLFVGWEIGNEEWNHDWQPEEYANWVRTVIQETRKVDPNIKLGVCGFIGTMLNNPSRQDILNLVARTTPEYPNQQWQIYLDHVQWSAAMYQALGDNASDIYYGVSHNYGWGPPFNATYTGIQNFDALYHAYDNTEHFKMMVTEWMENGDKTYTPRVFRYGALWRTKMALTFVAYPNMTWIGAHSLFGWGGVMYWAKNTTPYTDDNGTTHPGLWYGQPMADNISAYVPWDNGTRFDNGTFAPACQWINTLIDDHPTLVSYGADLGLASSSAYAMDNQTNTDLHWLIATNPAKTSLAGIFVNTKTTDEVVLLTSDEGLVQAGLATVQVLSCTDNVDRVWNPGEPHNWQTTSYNNTGAVITVPAQSVVKVVVPFAATADVNGDGIVDARDLAAVLVAMDTRSSDLNWNAGADLDHDGEVTSSDLSIVLANMQ